jgi:hypothetical protein
MLITMALQYSGFSLSATEILFLFVAAVFSRAPLKRIGQRFPIPSEETDLGIFGVLEPRLPASDEFAETG